MKYFASLLGFLSFSILVQVCQGKAEHKSEDYQCFVAGECTFGQQVDVLESADELQCLTICQATANCTWFTFFPNSESCELFSSCGTVDDTLCPECISGQKECSIPEPTCWVQGNCHGNVTHTEDNIITKEDCLSICKEFSLCNWFTYFSERTVCTLMLDCPALDEGCTTCVSGESRCEISPKGKTLIS